ncbi:MAG: cytochrome-c oxidase, cbb3-type subunit III [Hyphomicrobiaceae bacterium]
MAAHKEIDHVTGVETTGHVWDGDLKELNKPLPRWWLWVLYATIVWSIGYWIVYPAWPLATDYTKGIWGYSQRQVVMDQVNAGKAAQAGLRKSIADTKIGDIRNNPKLLAFAIAGGRAAFGDNCAACHGRGAQGFVGYPNLNDDDWIWGGKLEDIYQTIRFGIRNEDGKSRLSDMPKYGLDKLLEPAQINDAAEYVLKIAGKQHDATAAGRGEATFKEQCSACHGEQGQGNQELGAPKLTDNIWLYGGTKADILKTIQTGRGGVMPAWHTRLDDVTIKQLAIYVHSLGGGK